MNAHGSIDRFRAIAEYSCPTLLEIKDMINEVKYRCLYLLVEVFINVMNGLVMTLEEDKRFLCVWLLYYVSSFCRFTNGGAKILIKSYFMEIIFFFSAFSSSEVLGKNASIWSKLLTAACWSQEKREEGVKPTCFTSKATLVPQVNHSQYSLPIEVLNLIVESKSLPIEVNNSTIELHLPVAVKEKLGIILSCGF